MVWQGQPNDLICLAHEVAHAVQINLSNHAFMPPMAREVCAFLGELAVIEHAYDLSPDLFGALRDVWHKENEAYLGCDLEALSTALANPSAPYDYRQNYPAARLAAVELFRRGPGTGAYDLFSAGPKAMRHLPVEAMADRAADITNLLSPLPDSDAESPATDAYRSLGAVVVLDLAEAGPSAQMPMGAYYNAMLERMKARQVFVALDEARRPAGYATWPEAAESTDDIQFDRLVAPYGDSESLRESAAQYTGSAAEPANRAPCTAKDGEREIDQYAAIGYALELLARSQYHRQPELGRYFNIEIFPALRQQQVRFYLTPEGIPTAMITWAWLDEDVEREVQDTGRALRADEWKSGERLFLNDWVTPFGNTREVAKDVMNNVFPDARVATSLRRNPDGTVRRIKRWRRAQRTTTQGGSRMMRSRESNEEIGAHARPYKFRVGH